jgi:hypothetical protein
MLYANMGMQEVEVVDKKNDTVGERGIDDLGVENE